MLCESHTTISIIRHYVDVWRKREGWSRESVIQHIVEAHEKINGPAITGITFSDHADTFMRMKVNADRVYRWLDDTGKDTNLLPTNFIPSILEALPGDLKVRCADDLLRPLGLAVKSASGPDSQGFDRVQHTQSTTKESAEGTIAMAVIDKDAPIETMIDGLREIREAQESWKKAGDELEADIERRNRNQ